MWHSRTATPDDKMTNCKDRREEQRNKQGKDEEECGRLTARSFSPTPTTEVCEGNERGMAAER